ncbi:MAG: hypothetical protein E6772_10275 [Dysgonomonas sp.]|nr:hypothetical protein [Dysgonomonas sp.]
MKAINNSNSVFQNLNRLKAITEIHFLELEKDEIKNHKKIVEISHVGKLLMNLDETSYIEKVCEVPDFLINYNGNTLGIEHQTLTDNTDRSYEGFFENIFRHAESELKKNNSLPNFLANCWLYPKIEYKLNEKNAFIKLVVEIITEFIKSGHLIYNNIIEEISLQPHSEINVCPNFGAWWQKYLTKDILQNAINEKEKRIDDYRKSVKQIWLLIVIGGTKSSSYQISTHENYNIATTFDRIYLLEDVYNNLYQLK